MVNFAVSATAMTAIAPALDTWLGYNPQLESEILAQVEGSGEGGGGAAGVVS